MKIRYLGTAAAEGFPAVFCQCDTCRRSAAKGGKNIRTRSSILVNDTVLMDLGPDLYWQKVRENLDLGKLEAVFFTHSHTDHLDCTGLSLRGSQPYGFCHLQNDRPLQVYGNTKVLRTIAQGMEFEYGTGEIPSVQSHLLQAGEYVCTEGLEVWALAANHDPREECLLYLFMDDTDAVLAANDTGEPPAEFFVQLSAALKGRKLTKVSMDCTFGSIDRGPGGHMSVRQNILLRQKLLEIKAVDQNTRYFVTHFSHNCGMDHEQLCAHFEPEGFTVAWDGLEI